MEVLFIMEPFAEWLQVTAFVVSCIGGLACFSLRYSIVRDKGQELKDSILAYRLVRPITWIAVLLFWVMTPLANVDQITQRIAAYRAQQTAQED